jgi:hypothetical protein
VGVVLMILLVLVCGVHLGRAIACAGRGKLGVPWRFRAVQESARGLAPRCWGRADRPQGSLLVPGDSLAVCGRDRANSHCCVSGGPAALDVRDALEVSAVHSLAGFNLADELITRPPYSDAHQHRRPALSVAGSGWPAGCYLVRSCHSLIVFYETPARATAPSRADFLFPCRCDS